MIDDRAFVGAERLPSSASEINQLDFVIRQILSRTATATLVMVRAVENEGGLAATGFVDVQPMIAQIDGEGGATPHGIIHNVPYFRIQGGANAVIIDPVVGDIGLAIFASHDISSVKANKAPSNPGSRRRFDLADALYLGGFLNGVPTQYVRFSADGVEIQSETLVKIIAPNVTVEGNVAVDGTITATGNVVGDGKSLNSHIHSGVQTGGGNSGPPT